MDSASDLLPPKARRLRTLFDQDERLTKREIGDRLSCTERHALRLVEALREAGIPVEEEKNPRNRREKRFFLPSEHQRRGVVLEDLDEEAMYALTVAAQAAEGALGGTTLEGPLRRAFGMLLVAFGEQDVFSFTGEEQDAAWHFGALAASPVEPDVFRTVARAVDRRHPLQVDYQNGKGERSFKRCLNPLAIASINGTWQLAAYCHKRQGIREFNLVRLSNLRAFPKLTFDRPEGFDSKQHFAGRFGALEGAEPVTVRLRVAPERAVYFESKRYHRSQEHERQEDGSLLVSFRVRALDPVRAFVASWGPHVRALDPPALAERLAADAAATVQLYEDGP